MIKKTKEPRESWIWMREGGEIERGEKTSRRNESEV